MTEIGVLATVLLLLGAAEGRITALHEKKGGDERELRARTAADPTTYCDAPVAKGQVTFPESLAGRTTQNFDMFSGYVNVTEQDWLFYWFFEADNKTTDGGDDVPLIVWTNGGPGCSAMEGATTENGPLVLYRIKESYDLATGQLSNNPYAWNTKGHVLYVDQPKYVGNSFGYGEACHSSEEAGEDIVTFLQGWYSLFPQHADRKLIISGESYGGHYIPAWANAILDHNEAVDAKKEEQQQQRTIPMAGVVIGNGCVNDTVQNSARYVEFLNANDLLPADPSFEPTTTAAADVMMAKHIGYSPNFYDYRVRNVQCGACYSYNYTEWSYWFLKQEVMDALHICGDAGYAAFAGNAGGCISMPGFDSGDEFDYSGALGRALDAGVDVLLLYGKNDLACNHVGAHAMAATIPWSGKDGFAAAPVVDGTPCAGCQAQSYQPPPGNASSRVADRDRSNRNGEQQQQLQEQQAGKLIWVQVDAAGHMVPLDEPAAAAQALQMLLDEI